MMGAIIRMSGAELKSAKPQNDIPLYIAVSEIDTLLSQAVNRDYREIS